jgi:hypothetical protein
VAEVVEVTKRLYATGSLDDLPLSVADETMRQVFRGNITCTNRSLEG